MLKCFSFDSYKMGLSGKSKDIRYHRVDQSKNGEAGNSNFNFSIADDDDSDSELVNVSL